MDALQEGDSLREKVARPRPFMALVLLMMRVLCNWKQKDLAAALEISPNLISKVERGWCRRPVSRELLLRAARAMGRSENQVDIIVRLNWRLGGTSLSEAPGDAERQAALTVVADRLEAGYRRIFGRPSEERPTEEQERRLAIKRAVAAELWKMLAGVPRDLLKEVLKARTIPQQWGLAERIWLESIYAAGSDPVEAATLAELALVAAERSLDSLAGGPLPPDCAP